MNKIIHIPLWKSYRNEETKRLYLRFEFGSWKTGGSGGRNSDGSLRIYRRGRELAIDVTVCHGKVRYSLLDPEMY